MRYRDDVLREALEASIDYSGRIEQSFVLSYIVELVAQDRSKMSTRV